MPEVRRADYEHLCEHDFVSTLLQHGGELHDLWRPRARRQQLHPAEDLEFPAADHATWHGLRHARQAAWEHLAATATQCSVALAHERPTRLRLAWQPQRAATVPAAAATVQSEPGTHGSARPRAAARVVRHEGSVKQKGWKDESSS